MTSNDGDDQKQPVLELVRDFWRLISRDIVAYLFPLASETDDDPERFAGVTIRDRDKRWFRPIAIPGYRKPLIFHGHRVAKIVPAGLFMTGLILVGIIATIILANT